VSLSRKSRLVAGVAATLAALSLLAWAVGLVRISTWFPAPGQPASERAVGIFVAGTLVASLLHVVASVLAYRSPPRVLVVILVAAAARLVLLFGAPQPILEGDPARTRFDARLMRHGLNPYEFPPAQLSEEDPEDEILTGNEFDRHRRARELLASQPDMPAVEQLRRPDLRTTSTPLGLWIASLADAFKPDSTRGYAYLVLVGDALAIFFLVGALRSMALPPGWVVVYAWSPVLLKECYVTLSVDAFVMPALAGLIWCIAAGRRLVSAVPLAIAAALRWPLLLLLPGGLRRAGVLAVPLALIFLALPFLPLLPQALPAADYAQGSVHAWRFVEYNSAVENLVRTGLEKFEHTAKDTLVIAGVPVVRPEEPLQEILAKVFCLVLLLGVTAWTATRFGLKDATPGEERRAAYGDLFVMLASVLLLAPVLQPQHTLWLLPLLVVRPFGLSWLALPGLVSLSYLTHLNGPNAADLLVGRQGISFRVVEYGAFALLLLLDLLWGARMFGQREVTYEDTDLEPRDAPEPAIGELDFDLSPPAADDLLRV